MTVNTDTSTESYTGNGSTTSFAIPFYFLVDTDLLVQHKTAAGVTSTWVLNSDYTLAGAGNKQGGTIIPTVVMPADDVIFISRDVDPVQQTEYPVNGPFPAASHERALDRLTMLIQQALSKLTFGLFRDPLGNTFDLGGGTLTNSGTAVGANDVPNLVQTQGLIVGGAAPALAGGNGSALVGFTQAGTGAVLRTVQAKQRDVVHVDDFGAVADYNSSTDTGTDNTAAFGRAYAYLVSIGGGTIKLGRGNYLGRFSVVDPFINVVGEGVWATTLWNVDNSPVISISNAARTVKDVSFKDFAINNRNHVTWSLAEGIRITGSVFSNGCDFLTFKNIYMLQMNYGVNISGRTIWNLWENVRVAFSLSHAMNVNSTDNCGMQNFVSCRFASATGHGIFFSSTAGNIVPTFNWNFEQCDIEANSLCGVRITGTGAGIQAWKFHNCYWENNTQGIAVGGGGGNQKANVHVDTTNALGLSFDSCTFFGTNTGNALDYGVFVNTAAMSTVAGEVDNSRFGISTQKDIQWGDGVKIGANVYSGAGNSFNRQTSLNLADLSTPGKTFTPALKFGGASVGMTYSNQIGRYIQIGNILFFEIYLSLSAKGTSTGQATITGLPVATAASPAALLVAFSTRVDQLAAGVANVEARAAANSTVVELAKFAAGAATNLADTDFGGFTAISVSGYYFTA